MLVYIELKLEHVGGRLVSLLSIHQEPTHARHRITGKQHDSYQQMHYAAGVTSDNQ